MRSPGLQHTQVSSGTKPITASSPSVFCVLAHSKRGIPNKKHFVTTFGQARAYLGDFDVNSYTMYVLQVLMDFHGANQVWVSRVVGTGAVKATGSIGTDPTDIDVELQSPGSDGNNFQMAITKHPVRDEYSVSLTAPLGTSRVELYRAEALSSDPANAKYLVTYLNTDCNWVTLTDNMASKATFDALFTSEAPIVTVTFAGGADDVPELTDFQGDSALKTGVYVFDTEDGITGGAALMVPDNVITLDAVAANAQQSLDASMITFCDGKEYLNYITVVPQGQTPAAARTLVLTTWGIDSVNTAVYYNWTKITDPVSGLVKLIPPHGTGAGVWAETDAGSEGVHKAPANLIARGIVGLEHEDLTATEHGLLNEVGINVIMKDGAIRVMGARMRTNDAEWKYIHVRRTYQMFWRAILNGLKWTTFEVKDGGSGLFGKITRNVDTFFRNYDRRYVRNGALYNYASPTDAGWYVVCSEQNNANVPVGHVKVNWGVSIVDTAEFIDCESALWDGGEETRII